MSPYVNPSYRVRYTRCGGPAYDLAQYCEYCDVQIARGDMYVGFRFPVIESDT